MYVETLQAYCAKPFHNQEFVSNPSYFSIFHMNHVHLPLITRNHTVKLSKWNTMVIKQLHTYA
jgi:hypothetical protein